MKTLIFITCLIYSSSLLAQEVYQVIHVKGKISVTSTGKLIQRGDKIRSDEKIVFSSKTDFIAALSNKKGRMMIKPDAKAETESELTSYLKDVISASSGQLSTRGVYTNRIDLENYLKDDFLVLDGKTGIAISQQVYKMDEKNFFYLKYQYQGEEVNKKLSHNADTLFFIESEIYSVDGNAIEKGSVSKMHLYYYESEWEHSNPINPISLKFPSNEEVISEVEIIVNYLNDSGSSSKYIEEEVKAYLIETYGKVHTSNYKKWFEKNFEVEQ